MSRDMTPTEFEHALKKYGIRHTGGFMDYYHVTDSVAVSGLNAGTTNRRRILAFLIKEQARVVASDEAEAQRDRDFETTMHFLAQGVINISEGPMEAGRENGGCYIEGDSPIHKAMAEICKLVSEGDLKRIDSRYKKGK